MEPDDGLGLVQQDPFVGLVLPERDPLNERCLTLEDEGFNRGSERTIQNVLLDSG